MFFFESGYTVCLNFLFTQLIVARIVKNTAPVCGLRRFITKFERSPPPTSVRNHEFFESSAYHRTVFIDIHFNIIILPFIYNVPTS
jgi:hypothetical protein